VVNRVSSSYSELYLAAERHHCRRRIDSPIVDPAAGRSILNHYSRASVTDAYIVIVLFIARPKASFFRSLTVVLVHHRFLLRRNLSSRRVT